MPDLIVIVPGILGSVLVRDNRELWGLSGHAIIGNLLSLGRPISSLQLPPGIADDAADDGVVPTRLMPDLHALPGLWKIDGYSRLVTFLEEKFTLTRSTPDIAGNLLLFPYDWRLSNVHSAQRLSDEVVPALDRWRKHSGNPHAKLILICHSMGGLVARWFLEAMGGRDLAHTLITIGTPYGGSIRALEKLVNGFSVGLGRLRVTLDSLVRSFPSVYQLLPTYRCLDVGSGQLQSVDATSLPGLGDASVREGVGFHSRLQSRVTSTSGYQTFAIKGVSQPTFQSAVLSGDVIEPLQMYNGQDLGGDGTVPRPSSHPPQWNDDALATFAAQAHASLQNTDEVLLQIFAILTARSLGNWLTTGSRIGVLLPDLIRFGETLTIEAISEDADASLPLEAAAACEDGTDAGPPILLTSHGDGRYSAPLPGLKSGAWRITVRSATPIRQVDPVTDITLVWADAPT